MVAKQDFERFLNERAHGVVCSVCGRQDWMMNVNGDTENILIMCSHCGHVVSFDRDYVEAMLDKLKSLSSDGSDNDGSNADKPVDCRLADLPVEPVVNGPEPAVKAVEPVVDLLVESVEATSEIGTTAVDSGVERSAQVRERFVDSCLGITDRLRKAILDFIRVVKAKLHPL